MRTVIQRVSEAGVTVNGVKHAEIKTGLVILAGFENDDQQEDLEWLSRKILQLRIFDDEQKVPNLSIQDIPGEILVVSQFTLHASVKKGNRPSYIAAAKPDIAIPLYERFIQLLSDGLGSAVRTGIFGADMKVNLINDGPLTIWIDSKNRI